MHAIVLSLLLAQAVPAVQRPGVVVQEGGVTKGRATTVDFASGATVSVTDTKATVTVSGGGGGGGGAPTTAQYWTGAADATLSAEKNLGALATGLVLNTGGVPSAYAGATCTTPNLLQVLSASGAPSCYRLKLSDLANPNGDAAFAWPSGAKMLFTFTGSTDEAFTVHGDGSFSGVGDLVHFHKTGTGSTLGADILHVEADTDTVINGVRITMANSTRSALATNASVSIGGGLTVTGTAVATQFTGPLAGNANTATALSTSGGTTGFWRGDNTWAVPPAPSPNFSTNGQFFQATQATVGTNVRDSPTLSILGDYWDGSGSQPAGATMLTNVTSTVPAWTWKLQDFGTSAVKFSVTSAGVATATTFSGALSGNASTATALSTSGATTRFYWAGDNSWRQLDPAGGGGAPTSATYITQTPDGTLSAEQALSSLSTGLVKVTTGTGVLSTAASGTDYGPPTSGNATGLVLSTTGTGAHAAYGGTTCTNQFPRSLNGSGAATCASVDLSADTAATLLPIAKGGTNSSATATNGGVAYGSGTAFAFTAAGSAGQSLFSNGAAAPTWGNTDRLVMLTADYTNATTGMTNTALTWTTPAVVSRSTFDCLLIVSHSAATLGTQFDVTSSVAPTAIVYELTWVSAAGTAPGTGGTSAFVTATANSTAVGPAAGLTTKTLWKLKGSILHTSTSSTVTIRAKASSAGTATVSAGSACQYGIF